MRNASGLLLLALLAGCMQVDENPHWSPKVDYPPWAYDCPSYYRPTEELKPLEWVDTPKNRIPIYYSNSEYFFIRHPSNYSVNGEPRVAVWCSTDQGKNWQRSGYFGVEQTHFLFKAETDGPHWIRFVGPGQGVTECPPGMPHQIFVVDTQSPQITISVSPSPWEDDGKNDPHFYKIGDKVTIKWSVTDENLVPKSIKLEACFADFPHNLVWSHLPVEMAASGEAVFQILPETVGHGGLKFKIEAADKAGNVGVAFSDPLRVSSSGKATTQSVSQPSTMPAGKQWEAIVPEPPTLDELGWPMAGALIRGETCRELKWMPESASDHDNVELQFTSDNGQTWFTINNLSPKSGSKAIMWRVPKIISRDCRLRFIVPSQTAQPTVLATSERFVVNIAIDSVATTQPATAPTTAPSEKK